MDRAAPSPSRSVVSPVVRPVICIGAAHWDIVARAALPVPRGADVPGQVTRAPSAADPCVAEARLALIGASDAKARRLVAGLAHPRATLYLNRREAERLCAAPFPTSRAAALALRERGAAGALVTDGAAPAAFAGACGVLTARPDLVDVANLTGAGDALVAAHLAAEARGLTAEEAFAEAIAAAGRHVTRRQGAARLVNAPLLLAREVAAARAEGRPVVALESTIVTHGMPWPHNLETARAVEADVRAAGAVPATVAVMDGSIRIGLEPAELAALAERRDALKLSRADLAPALVRGTTGSTTVAATMIAARLAGIEVFATGGIGGVHRGAESSFDISADLLELAQTPVTVVAAGAKAVLDLPKTYELLETLGVPVIAVGQDELPAFWSRASGLPAPLRIDDPADIAAAHRMRARLGLPGGQLVAYPVPPEADIPLADIEQHIEAALALAATKGLRAKAVTPFLLEQVVGATGGRALEANIALVRSNARLAAEIAARIAELP